MDIIDKMNNRMKELGRNIQMIYKDSKAYLTNNSSQLQGGMMNIVSGRIVSFYNKETVRIDQLSKQIAF